MTLMGFYPRRCLIMAAAIAFAAFFSAAASAEGFDKPLRKVVVDLGRPSDEYGKEHDRLTCYYYSHVMVKEVVNSSVKGAVSISAIRVQAAETPPCAREVSAGEHLNSEYGAYFWGVKNDFIFLIDADGAGAGWHFWTFDPSTFHQVFDDERLFLRVPEFLRTPDGELVMRYWHVFFAECSLMKNGVDCWKQVMAQNGLRNARMPRCEGYDSNFSDPSLIAYPIEIALSPKFPKRILAGAARCFPQQ